ncbi:MAG: hypothetical protein QNJ47_09990 [Nostocaceae cyanobacterium]|nr:hypothetical protein [Nostocaceae cyanobacterium]
MAAPSQTEDAITRNQRSLKCLERAIAFSDNQFSLVLVRCNYRRLQERILRQLQGVHLPNHWLQRVVVPHNVTSLYTTIHSQLDNREPSALMVLGLESVDALDDLLSTINHIRDEFRKRHPFPMVLWVNDEVLYQMRRFAPDFASWAATPIRFEMTTEELMEFLQEETDSLFAKFLKNSAIPAPEYQVYHLHGNLRQVRDYSSYEFEYAIKDLESRGVDLQPRLSASLEFVFGLDEYVSDRINLALIHFQESLEFWQQQEEEEREEREEGEEGEEREEREEGEDKVEFPLTPGWGNPTPTSPSPHHPITSSPHHLRQGVLLFSIGLCYYRLGERSHSEGRHHWKQAKLYFQKCLGVFEKAEHLDIVAQFISWLAEVLQQLHKWRELNNLVEKSLELHQTYGTNMQLGCDYGFLAEVAIRECDWLKAIQLSQIALWKLSEAQERNDIDEGLFPLLLGQVYRLILAKAQRHIQEEKLAQQNLATASEELQIALENSDYRYNAHRYIRLLRKLRQLYFQENQYLEAFIIRQKRRSVEQQYGFRAFIGAGRLEPQRQDTNPVLQSPVGSGTIALEISASGRERNINELIARISRPAQKLTVIHGHSGVGKSSTVTAGLVPALQNRTIGDQIAIPVVLQVYTDWVRELGKSMATAITEAQGETVMQVPPYPNTPLTIDGILQQLQENANNYLITVLIFDQFEEFFFGYPDRKQKAEFDNFICDVLQIPFVKIIFSLREDYIHHLLEFKKIGGLDLINNNILDNHIRYQLNNFSIQDAKNVIQQLTERSQVNLEAALIDAVVEDLSAESGEVRPIELQVVGAQLQDKRITTLEQYKPYRPNKLIEKYIKELIKDCGADNERAALLVLYLLTDENNKRPFKTRAELSAEIADLENAEQLDLVLEILVRSGLVILFPDVPERYQLIHDYLVDLIRYLQQDESSWQKQLNLLRNKVEEQEEEIGRLNSALKQKTQQPKLLDKEPQQGLDLLTELKELRKREELSRLEIAELKQQQLEAELINTEKQRISEARLNHFLKIILSISVVAILALTASIAMAVYQWRQALLIASQAASASSEALFPLDKDIDSLKQALKAGRKLQRAILPDSATQEQVRTALYQVVYNIKERNRLEGHTSEVNGLSFSPDGTLIASASADNTIKIWQKNGKLLHTLEGHSNRVNSINFSPDGKIIASTSTDKTVKIWSIDGKFINTLQGHQDVVNSVIFSPDGNQIASASADKTIKIWNREGKLLNSITGNDKAVISLAWSPNGQTIAAATDKSVKLWSQTGKLLNTLTGHTDTVLDVTWSPNGNYIASASFDTTVKIWDKKGRLVNTLSGQFGHKDGVKSVTFSPQGNIIASASIDQTVKLWNLQGQLLNTIKGHNDWVNNISFSPDGRILASASSDSTIKLWHWQNVQLRKLPGHSNEVTKVSFSPKGEVIASASKDKTVKIWNPNGKLLTTLSGHEDEVWDVTFSPDGNMLASASHDQTVKLWNRNGQLINTLSGHSDKVLGVSWSPDGQTIASASHDQTVKLWNRNGKLLTTLSGHKKVVNWVSFSPNGSLIASASDDTTVKIWNRDGKLLYTFTDHSRPVYGVVWSADGKTIASASIDGTVRLWTPEGQLLKTLRQDGDRFTSVSFSPDGKTLAATSYDKVRVWNREGTLFTLLITLKGQKQELSSVSFSPDSKTLVVGGDKGTVILQNLADLELESLLDKGCSWLDDYFDHNSKMVESDRELCP